ncbi:deoxyribodipyrimidine photo-lyase [soil metagenome]
MKTIIVWFRNDLRIHDHPALATACADADFVVPLFITNDTLLHGEHRSANRNRFLLESLKDLQQSLQDSGGDLVIRNGDAAEELVKLVKETNAEAIYYTADYTPFAIKRDKAAKASVAKSNVAFRSFPGRLAVSSLEKLHTKAGTTHKVFTPFWKNWLTIVRRDIADTPQSIQLPSGLTPGTLPELKDVTTPQELSPNALPGGETAGRKRLHAYLNAGIEDYHQTNNDMAANQTSRLSPYLHFGCVSAREIETLLPDNAGARAWHRQLAWREFYHYIVFNNPSNTTKEFQEKYRSLSWTKSPDLLSAWQQGKTGYPVVDAAMRQLNEEGWMHNRGRLIVGSFLTKDLWLDWRDGERYFMQMLIDGDTANNNGNWQWIASVGVDPAPVYRRLYNPSTQRDKFDPSGAYTKKFVPELANVPDKYLSSPWTMPIEVQQEIGCIIGKDYPAPIVDHKQARLAALEQYYNAATTT